MHWSQAKCCWLGYHQWLWVDQFSHCLQAEVSLPIIHPPREKSEAGRCSPVGLALLLFVCFALSERQASDATVLRQITHRFLETQPFEPPVELNRIPSQIVAGLRIGLVKSYPVGLLPIDPKRGVPVGGMKRTRSPAPGIQFHVLRHKRIDVAGGHQTRLWQS
jgi:hypothetical protein